MECVVIGCQEQYPYLKVGTEGFYKQIDSDIFLFFPNNDEDLPPGCERQDFCGYVFPVRCLCIL